MAGTIVHLVVAEYLLRYINNNNLRYCFDKSLDIDENVSSGNIVKMALKVIGKV